MLMNKAKGYSALFLLVIQPIYGQGNRTYVLIEFYSSFILDYVEIPSG